MASTKKISTYLKTNNDTGFGNDATAYGGRFINKDGTFNLRKEGINFLKRFSIYQQMLHLSRWKFFGFIFIFYILINLIFTASYLLCGYDQFEGVKTGSEWQMIKQLYYFSTQTFTTVGYGRINPSGDAASLISSFEALCGFLSFAIVTGLMYGRFARPRSFLEFSEKALVAPYKDKTALMFRFAPYKDNHVLTNVEIKVTIALRTEDNGNSTYRFYDLPLERHKVDNLPMNWTVVHPIDEQSPIFGFTEEDMRLADAELYVLVSGFDEVYSCTVLRRTSYTYNEMQFNAKFIPMYHESDDGMTTILEMNKLNKVKEAVNSPIPS